MWTGPNPSRQPPGTDFGARLSPRELGERRGGPAARDVTKPARQCQPQLSAALVKRVAVEPEQPGGPQLIAARQL
jgi:hypothetical protein